MSPVSLEEARLEETLDEGVLDGLAVDADRSGEKREDQRSREVNGKCRGNGDGKKGRKKEVRDHEGEETTVHLNPSC